MDCCCFEFKRKKLRKVKILGLKRVLSAVLLALCCETAQAGGFRQEMDVEIGLFDAADVVLQYDEQAGGRYVISAEVQTANLFQTLYPFTGRYESRGKKGDADGRGRGILPEIYQTYTQSRSHIRTKRIFYDGNGVAYQRISTKDAKKNTVPIRDVPASADAADLQAVFAELLQQFEKSRSCNMRREIYDGKKHYRVVLADEGTDNRYFDWLRRTENSYKCSFYIENLKENNDNILWDVSAERPIFMWIGVQQETGVPYVLEIKIDTTPLGSLTVRPKSFVRI